MRVFPLGSRRQKVWGSISSTSTSPAFACNTGSSPGNQVRPTPSSGRFMWPSSVGGGLPHLERSRVDNKLTRVQKCDVDTGSAASATDHLRDVGERSLKLVEVVGYRNRQRDPDRTSYPGGAVRFLSGWHECLLSQLFPAFTGEVFMGIVSGEGGTLQGAGGDVHD